MHHKPAPGDGEIEPALVLGRRTFQLVQEWAAWHRDLGIDTGTREELVAVWPGGAAR
ncbi:hypothetical protein [Bradyrhizobium sp. Tv2a-2]|uniref:hypothetical protein n=1 Tax=Bradyrhizobium sp. Tv2a-2 TaxID=113395 RepID=UPI0012EB99CC|nr:hypothetical protein [Bradyrhizobium sp. Tv2a-2]